jgi:uncharacterized protein
MSDLLPIFPLPNVVLFPQVFLPLRIFEPRYRSMVADALAGDRMIGMALLRPGWEATYEERPPIYKIGCSGVISHCEKLPDGRYNIVLRGLERFEIEREDHARPYRRAEIRPLPESPLNARDEAVIGRHRHRLESLLAPIVSSASGESIRAAAMNSADLVNALSQYLDFEPLEKQALLERNCLLTRAEALIELLEMRVLLAKTPGATRTPH